MELPLTLDEALGIIKKINSEFYFRRESEHVNIDDAIGRELSQTIFARTISPEFDIAAMDGYAFRINDGYPLKISGRLYAGDRKTEITKGTAMAVATGALLPLGADAVLKVENAEMNGNLLYGKALKKWENVFRAGSDYMPGEKIFEKNHRIMPQSAALLYSLGIERVPVYRKIRGGIISTGTEIHNGMIKNTNAVLIQGFLKELGSESTFIGTVPDDYDETKHMLMNATNTYDLVITTGGVSVGERDYIADIIAEMGDLVFHRVAIKPGKPLAVGVINDTPVFGLPGKPTGAFAALEMVVRRYFTDIPRATRQCTITEDIMLQEKGFQYILFVKITQDGANTMGYNRSGFNLFKREYITPIISASPRSTIVDGYAIIDKDIKQGEKITVHLLN